MLPQWRKQENAITFEGHFSIPLQRVTGNVRYLNLSSIHVAVTQRNGLEVQDKYDTPCTASSLHNPDRAGVNKD